MNTKNREEAMRKLFKIFMVVGLGAVLSLAGFPFHHVLTGDRERSGNADSLFGIFSSVSSAHAGGACLNYTTQKKNELTTWCRDTQCSSHCSGQAACISECQKGCNRYAQKMPSGPWLAGQCHVDEDQANTAFNACKTLCQTDYPGVVSNVYNCEGGCEWYWSGLLQMRGL